ncbi:hypothetical protein Hanom_Chr03g00260271 [Helianthus anomalus]
MDGVNEPDENGKIPNLLVPDTEKQSFGRKSQNRLTGQTSWTKMAFYSNLKIYRAGSDKTAIRKSTISPKAVERYVIMNSRT